MTLDEFLQKIREDAYHSADLGAKFERFVKQYLQSPSYTGVHFTDVWLWSEFPYQHGHDVGIDLVARDSFGDFTAVQCKCYQPGTAVSKEDVDTFLSASGKTFYVEGRPTQFVQRILISTNDNWSANAEDAIKLQNPPVTRIGLALLRKTIEDAGIFDFEKGRAIVRRFDDLPHQTAAIRDVLKGFETADRGQLIMACGTGKTFTALRIAEELKCKTVLFMVPSISLLSQSLRVWAQQAKTEIATLAVCSDGKADREEGDIPVCDLGFPATTSTDRLVKYGHALKFKPPKGMTVVFSTYQSVASVSEAQQSGAFDTFDLIVCDEAHRTTGATFEGTQQSNFTKIHGNENVRGKRRLYMTATPRVYGENAKKKAEDEFIELASMDDETVYGREFHHLSFSAAVGQDLLSDYKVQILAVSEEDIRAYGLRDYDGDGTIDNVDDVGKWIGCWKAFNKKLVEADMEHLGSDRAPMRSAVAFSSSIRGSKTFTRGFNKLVETFAGTEGLRPAAVHHVDGTMNALVRGNELDWLRRGNDPGNTECRILSNAKCLSEGVDVPGLDAIAFLSPKNSFVEIVQAIGRVMRKAPGKQFGYVIIPVVLPEGLEPEDVLSDNKRFKVVWDILAAIRSHDDGFHTLDNKVDIVRIQPLDRPGGGGGCDGPEPPLPPPNIPPELFVQYQKAIQAKLAKVCGEKRYWSTWAEDVAKVVQAQIVRIRTLLEKPGNPYEKEFDDFLTGIQLNLNPTVARGDAIEMLAQQLVSAPIFSAVFADFDFARENPVSKAMAPMLDRLNESMTDADKVVLEAFTRSVRNKAAGHSTSEQKQHIIIELYNNFFNIAFKETVEKLGIVYTPIPCVDFILHSVALLLKRFFNKELTDKDVHLIDPFTGTGTFVVRALQTGIIKPEDLARKYASELHANEIVLLAYYIAAINIEATYHDLAEKIAGGPVAYKPFDGIVLTDTFQLGEKQMKIDTIFPENAKRAKKQRELPIRVIVGNPPYNVSKGVSYPDLENRIRATYAEGSTATLKSALYDSYIKAFRWASDRMGDEGIVAFITNGGWLDAAAMSGMRASFQKEFSHVYVFNLRGNQRTSGETSRREGGKIFGSGSRTPIAITILVKTKKKSGEPGTIHYHDIGDYLSREEKLKIVEDFHDVGSVPWQTLTPDKHNDWLNQRNGEFDSYVPLAVSKGAVHEAKAFFQLGTVGTKTNRDTWCWSFSRAAVKKNMAASVAFYNGCADAHSPTDDPKRISWTRSVRQRCENGIRSGFNPEAIVAASYRPFQRSQLYLDRFWNEVTGIGGWAFPASELQNKIICVSGTGGTKDFSCLITDCVPDYELIGKSQCFPLYWYEERDDSGGQLQLPGLEQQGRFVRHDGVSDFILHEFQSVLGSSVTKEDIFYYVYGALHSPAYRAKFEADLKKQLPRLPLPEDKPKFDRVQKIGRALARLHLNYEHIEPWPLEEVVTPGAKKSLRVEKLRFGKKSKDEDKSVIVVNPTLQLVGVPAKAYEYVVNGRSAIEWIFDRYQIKTDADSGIVNDPNKWGEEHGDERYIVDLLKRVVRVSMETVDLVARIDGESASATQERGGLPTAVVTNGSTDYDSLDIGEPFPIAAQTPKANTGGDAEPPTASVDYSTP